MADVKMPESIPCLFDRKGWAPCKKPSTNGWCSKHENAKCVSCGAQATRSCDGQMGGLACGQYLCDTCQHGRGGNHVTAEVHLSEVRERIELEREEREREREILERGVPLGLPKHLKELLAGDRAGYELMTCFMLELKHGLMGFFPAIKKDSKIIALVSDETLIFRIWRSLDPRDSRLLANEYLVNRSLGVAYHMETTDFNQRYSRPLKLFSIVEVESMFNSDPEPFEWASGLMGGYISEHQFEHLIEQAAKEQGLAA